MLFFELVVFAILFFFQSVCEKRLKNLDGNSNRLILFKYDSYDLPDMISSFSRLNSQNLVTQL